MYYFVLPLLRGLDFDVNIPREVLDPEVVWNITVYIHHAFYVWGAIRLVIEDARVLIPSVHPTHSIHSQLTDNMF